MNTHSNNEKLGEKMSTHSDKEKIFQILFKICFESDNAKDGQKLNTHVRR